MNANGLDKIRNIGIMAHIDAGKTTVSERLLFFSGKTYKMGEVHDGAATMDWMEQERDRGITITSAATTLMWKEHRITLIDTPGHVDFTAEVERSLRVLDGAIALFCAVGGVQPQSEQVWRQSEKYDVPKLVFINKMDRVGADFFGVIAKIRDILGANVVPVVLPIGQGEDFRGIIDLVSMKATYFKEGSIDRAAVEEEIPDDMRADAEIWRARLMETCSEQDDAMLEKFLETGSLSDSELQDAIRKAAIARSVVPAFCGAAFKNMGIQRLLDGVADFLPSPLDIPPAAGVNPQDNAPCERPADENAPFSALAFKIMSDKHMGKLTYLRIYSGTVRQGDTVLNSPANVEQRIGRMVRMHANRQETVDSASCGDIVAVVGLNKTRTGDTICVASAPIILEKIEFPAPVMSISVKPASRMDSEKSFEAIHRLTDEDPTFTVSSDQETSETILSGMGELHLEIIVDRLFREFGVRLLTGKPEVAYRETVNAPSEGEYKHVKQSGGRGQYGHVVLRVEPLPPGGGFEFVNAVRGGRVPSEYIPSVEKGVISAMAKGPFARYPVVDVRVTLLDGSSHAVDSSDFAFQEAARVCVRNCLLEGRPKLIEPIMFLEVTTPDEYTGPISGSICQRRGRIDAMDIKGGHREITGHVPLSEMFGYSTVIRTLTQGRAAFTMNFEYYEAVPSSVAEELVKKRRRAGGAG